VDDRPTPRSQSDAGGAAVPLRRAVGVPGTVLRSRRAAPGRGVRRCAVPCSARGRAPPHPWAGLAACLGLAFWVDVRVWIIGLALGAAGLAWHAWRVRS